MNNRTNPPSEDSSLMTATNTQLLIKLNIRFLDEIKTLTYNLDLKSHQEDLFDLQRFKKKILNLFNITLKEKKNVLLYFSRIYPTSDSFKTPILSQTNYVSILQYLIDQEQEIHMLVDSEKPMKMKKVKEQSKNQKKGEQFDSEGSLESENQNEISLRIKKNLPSNAVYKGKKTVRCHFCFKSNEDSEAKKYLGKIYGPLQHKLYSHLLCAIWCSHIWIDDETGKLKNVAAAYKQAKSSRCQICDNVGAGLMCHDPQGKCTWSAHYKCITMVPIYLSWQNYKFRCLKCDPAQVLIKQQDELGWKQDAILDSKSEKEEEQEQLEKLQVEQVKTVPKIQQEFQSHTESVAKV